MSSKYNKNLKDYFNKKKKYEDKKKRILNRIKKDPNIDKSELKMKLKNALKNLKDNEGHFKIINNKYTITKNNKLVFELKINKQENNNEKIIQLNKRLQEIKQNIIIGKLNNIFEFENDDKTINDFDTLKNDYDTTNYEYNLITKNYEKQELIHENEELIDLINSKDEIIKDIKNEINSYKELIYETSELNSDELAQNENIKNIAELYQYLQPIILSIQESKQKLITNYN